MLLIWKEKDFIKRINLYTEIDNSLQYKPQEDLTDLSKNILARIMEESEYKNIVQEIHEKYVLNHPFIFITPQKRCYNLNYKKK